MTESLSFKVIVANTEERLQEACAVRVAAYDHHLSGLGQQMANPDAADFDPESLVLLAIHKVSGHPIGTARLISNRTKRLMIESCYPIGEGLRHKHLAEVTRFATHPARSDPKLRLALIKAVWLASIALQVDHWVIGARSRALVRTYRSMGFVGLTAPDKPVALPYAGNLAHHILAMDVLDAPRVWQESGHPLHAMVRTYHPDIELGGLRRTPSKRSEVAA